MPNKYTQENREAAVKIDGLAEDNLLLKSMVGMDKVGQPFNYIVEMLKNPGAEVKISSLVGKKLTITLNSMKGGPDRYFHGYIADIRSGGATNRSMESYHASVVPWFWFLKKSSKCRIFKGLTVNQILETVFKSFKFASGCYELKDLSEHPAMEHCVQYQETDFAFASRLMEEFGISYYFEHEKSKHKMVLLDSLGKRPAAPACGFKEMNYSVARKSEKTNVITRLESRHQVVSDKFAQLDYNFGNKDKLPTILTYEQAGEGDAQGDFTKGSFEQSVYDGIFIDDGVSEPEVKANIKEFKDLAKVRLGALQAEQKLMYVESDCRGLHAGYEFKLKEYDIDPTLNNKEYYVLSVRHQIELGEYGSGSYHVNKRYTCTITVIPKETEYHPPLLTPKARIYGPQTAVVVGDDDKKEKQIYTDKFGRIKVMFHWDRKDDRDETDKNSDKKAEVDKNPQNLSCWVRISQGWAGNKWGSFFLPRVGQEVIVEFLDGDPDRPIVTGSVYNGKMLTPYHLPDNDTVSTIKSNSVGDDGKKAKEANYNEIRFEDREKSEQIYIHAAKAMDTEIIGDRRETVGGNSHLVIGDGDKKNSVDKTIGNRVVDINAGHDVLTLDKGDSVVNLKEGNQHLMVGKDQNITVSGNQLISTGNLYLGTGGEIHIKSTKGAYLDEASEIHIKSAKGCYLDDGATIHIKSGSKGTFVTSTGDVHIKGANVVVAATTKLQLAAGGSFVNLSASGVEIKGTKVDINGGGSAGSATAATAATAASEGGPGEAPAPEVQKRLETKERVEDKKVKKDKINPGKLD
jgi:type VI secretion system secreted protein VgrG